MSLALYTESAWTQPSLPDAPHRDAQQRRRILEAVGSGRQIPRVSPDSLARYYEFLQAHLPLPFAAHFPEPSNAREDAEFRCVVVELLDPTQHLGDEFDGLFCRARKGRYEVNLPLIDLCLPEGSPQQELIEDYWRWFWHWR